MLKTVDYSRATKTRGIAVTYRAGTGEKYATCPASCKMNCSGKGAEQIDADYLDALLDAVPRRGVSFTYSHFDWKLWADKLAPGKTVINFSTESPLTAAAATLENVPSVVVLREDYWQGSKTQSAPFGVRIVRCPAEYREGFSCADCGNGEPLCARRDRDYIIGFSAHGPSKKKAADVKPGADVMPTREIAGYGGTIPRTGSSARPTRKRCGDLRKACRRGPLFATMLPGILGPNNFLKNKLASYASICDIMGAGRAMVRT
jgi:hypothetical protein